jgi:hypothetical protein
MKSENSERIRLTGTVIAAILSLSGCSSVLQLSSYQRPASITIDGGNQEWSGVPAYAAKGRFMLSVVNDDEYLYLCIATRDESLQMQLMEMGTTVWLDPEGGKSKGFGVRYPLGRQPGDRPPTMGGNDRNDQAREMRGGAQLEMEIVGADEADRMRLPVNNSMGIRVAIARSAEGMVAYELQVPLKKTPEHPYAVAVLPSAHIGLGIEIGSAGRQPGGNRSDFGGPPGGPDGGGRPPGNGMPGGQGGPPKGSMPSRESGSVESIELWFNVALSVLR